MYGYILHTVCVYAHMWSIGQNYVISSNIKAFLLFLEVYLPIKIIIEIFKK